MRKHGLTISSHHKVHSHWMLGCMFLFLFSLSWCGWFKWRKFSKWINFGVSDIVGTYKIKWQPVFNFTSIELFTLNGETLDGVHAFFEINDRNVFAIIQTILTPKYLEMV